MRAWLLCLLACLTTQAAAAEPTLLLRSPSVSGDHVAFVYAGDVWVADRDGAHPRRLTIHPGVESDPFLSPDGGHVAFTGHYDGNADVYVVSTAGGQPERLTFHPTDDAVRGWTPDGDAVLFRSGRLTQSRRDYRIFTVPVTGGMPEAMVMPTADRAAISPDGGRVAYVPFREAFQTWKRYRGGRLTRIWILDLATNDHVEIPREDGSDARPLWAGDEVVFLSDRAATMNLYAYGIDGAVRQLTDHDDLDVKDAAVHGRTVVYEQSGRLHELDLDSGQQRTLDIHISPDLPHMRPHREDAAPFIRSMDISPTGVRALFGARGEVLTVPAEDGDVRNLTRTVGVHERYPAWSPDGAHVAYLSDASGEYELVIADQDGLGESRTLALGDPTFYYGVAWSPDSERIAYTDKRLNLWVMDLDAGKPVLVDTDTYDHPPRSIEPVWSPDGQWIAYARRLDNHLRAVFLYDVEAGKTHQITDGMSDATSPTFSRDGKLLYFAASTNFALRTGWLDMTSYERPQRRALYVVVLDEEEPSPLLPEAGDEAVEPEEEEEEEEEVVVVVDLEGIDQRILALPVEEGDYRDLRAVEGGKLLYVDQLDAGPVLRRFDLEEQEATEFLDGVTHYVVSADGNKVLYANGDRQFGIVAAGEDAPDDGGVLDLSGLRVQVDPRAEAVQIFEDAWRIQRDFFYDPGMHGIDWEAMGERYRPWVAHVGHRDDLNYLLGELIGELVVGHAYRWGGDYPDVSGPGGGLLGADIEVVDGHVRIARILGGLNWNPEMRAPLTEPGVDVDEGDYLLAVNGVPVGANPYAALEGTAGVQTVLTVNARPIARGAREVTVVPIGDETALRHRDWVEANRRAVDRMTDGRVAYVYLPNTAWQGYTSFNRYFYAQLDREAVIIDERYNGGGSVADYIVDMLGRTVINYNATREGADYPSPLAVIDGPMVMIVNQDAGSGGDCLPHYFRSRGLGKLVGTRTWGGLIGIYDYPALIDGGMVTAPRIAFYGPDGTWTAENVGIYPDIEVEMTPREVIEGRDPQLEAAVEQVMIELKERDTGGPERPEYPDYSK